MFVRRSDEALEELSEGTDSGTDVTSRHTTEGSHGYYEQDADDLADGDVERAARADRFGSPARVTASARDGIDMRAGDDVGDADELAEFHGRFDRRPTTATDDFEDGLEDDIDGDLDGDLNSDDELAGEAGDRPRPTHSRMMIRRRRTLTTLAALTIGTLLIVLFARGRSWAWGAQTICDLLLVGYLVGLRREVRRERVRRAVRLARRTAARARATARREVRNEPPARPVTGTARSTRSRRHERYGRRAVGGYTEYDSDDYDDLAEPDDPIQQRRVV